jgi:hypothetical protein
MGENTRNTEFEDDIRYISQIKLYRFTELANIASIPCRYLKATVLANVISGDSALLAVQELTFNSYSIQ